MSAAKAKSNRFVSPVILVPVDFSPESLRALDYAAVLLKLSRGALHLVHVHDVDFSYAVPSIAAMPPVTSLDEIERHYQGRLRKLATKYSAKGPTHVHVKAGRAFDQICRLAVEIGADMIVIATHGRTGLKRLLLGSTAERVVQHAPCPVLAVREARQDFAALAPEGKKSDASRMKILVPIDFSECARVGLDYAITFARLWKAELVLLHTVQVLPMIASENASARERTPPLGLIERAARAQMRKLARQTDFGGVPYEAVIHVGYPAQQICQFADDHGIDLIITSTHGHSGFAHVLIGSVAEHIVRYAHCPVLVVPSRDTRRAA